MSLYLIGDAASSLAIESPGNNLYWMQPHNLWSEAWGKLLAAPFQKFCLGMDFNRSRLPWRQHIVHHKRDPGMLPGTMPFPGLCNVMPANVNGICLGVI